MKFDNFVLSRRIPAPIKLVARSSMRRLLAAIVVAGVMMVDARAQSSSRPMVQIGFPAHQTCVMGDTDVPCGELGSRLRALQIPLDADIHFIGDLEPKGNDFVALFYNAAESLERAGYKIKRAYIQKN